MKLDQKTIDGVTISESVLNFMVRAEMHAGSPAMETVKKRLTYWRDTEWGDNPASEKFLNSALEYIEEMENQPE